MWRYHTQTNGWSDIAQHVTIAPDGVIWTGRHWDLPPASAKHHNGKTASGPFMFEMIGDFDAGRDPFQDPQRDAALWVISLVQDRFDLAVETLKFHRQLGSLKTCPGTSIDYAEVAGAVRFRRGDKPAAPRGFVAATYNALGDGRAWLAERPQAPREDPQAELQEESGAHPADSELVSRTANGARGEPALDAQTLAALRPYVVNLRNAGFSEDGIFQTDAGDIDRIFGEELPRRIAALPKGQSLPVVLYAHGGLVDEKSGLLIAANQVPWWNANGCYPIQFVWETGLFESLQDILKGQRDLTRGFAADAKELWEKGVEFSARNAGGRRTWFGMKSAAASAFENDDAAGTIVVQRLARLAREHDGKVRLFAVGHSAGSIFHAHLLQKLAALAGPPVEKLFLFAPAITIANYKRLVDPLVGTQIQRVTMFTMSKDYELHDTCTPAYGKSLLYLVSHALEEDKNEPVLGLEECLRADGDLSSRFGLGGAPAGNCSVVWSQTTARSGPRASRSTTHGGFDNDVATMESVMREILGTADKAAIPQGFPPDAQARVVGPAVTPAQLAAVPVPAAIRSQIIAGTPAGIPASTSALPLRGVRKALCVGVDAYPDPDARLSGCVADAEAWAGAFAAMGFAVERLCDGEATRSTILTRLQAMISHAGAGDILVFQYSGHGTYVPDEDGDEPSGEDQALCPVDYETGNLLIDDDVRALFQGLPDRAHLTCFMDNCYSYSNTRFAVAKPTRAPVSSRPRFIKLSPEVIERYQKVRRKDRSAARSFAGATQEEMRWVVFSACDSDEKAYETGGQGDFSRIAVPLLARGGSLTNEQFQALVSGGLAPQGRQTPKLDCCRAARAQAFLSGSSSGDGDGRLFDSGPLTPVSVGGGRSEVAALLNAIARVLG